MCSWRARSPLTAPLPIQPVAGHHELLQPFREPSDQGVECVVHRPGTLQGGRIDTGYPPPLGICCDWLLARSTRMHLDGSPHMVYDTRPGVGRERVATARVKTHDRAPQADSSGLQRFCVGQVAQNLLAHDGVHQSVVHLHERVQAFSAPCLRLAKKGDLGGLAGVVRSIMSRVHRAPPMS